MTDDTQWVRLKMIVKIKQEESRYHREKGEVVSIKSPDRIIVRMPDDKEREFTEK